MIELDCIGFDVEFYKQQILEHTKFSFKTIAIFFLVIPRKWKIWKLRNSHFFLCGKVIFFLMRKSMIFFLMRKSKIFFTTKKYDFFNAEKYDFFLIEKSYFK
jgi:hypothetical protein